MTDFLIKSTIPLLVFLAIYHLVLEKEKMHVFNRFYLLFNLVFSLAIPFVTLEVIEVATNPIIQNSVIQINQGSLVIVEETNYFPILFWSIYGLITFLLSIRFAGNILKINSKINSNKKIVHQNAILVLLKEKVLPHTFLNYIFINEIDYDRQKIEAELFSHELTHVSQKHTLDILFIEILKTIFWFNPIFIFYKKAIQLNHEFLADEQVVKSYNDVPFYQNLLLSKANENQPFYLASNLNYSLTKKRLIMMTKTTSQTKALYKQIALIPLICGLVFSICIKTVAQEKTSNSVVFQKPVKAYATNDKRDAYYAGVRIVVKDGKEKIKIDKQFEELTLDEKNNYLSNVPNPYAKKSPTEKEFTAFKDSKKYAIWINEKHVSNNKLNDFQPNDIAYISGGAVLKNARNDKFPQPFQYHLYTQKYFNENLKNAHKKFSGKKIEIKVSNDENRNIFSAGKEKNKLVIPEKKLKDSISEITKPEYTGGMQKFYKFFSENYKLTSGFKGNGKIYISFIVETDGTLSDFEVLRDLGFDTGEEAVRVLKLSPKWIPGKEDGKLVRMKFSLPISLQSK